MAIFDQPLPLTSFSPFISFYAISYIYRDENGQRKKQLKILDEAARVWNHDRNLSNLALKMVHSGGFENVNLLEGHGCKATLSAT